MSAERVPHTGERVAVCFHAVGWDSTLTYSARGWHGVPLSVRLTCRNCGEQARYDAAEIQALPVLHQRIAVAAETCLGMASAALEGRDTALEATRLSGKAEGLRLALSYIEEAARSGRSTDG